MAVALLNQHRRNWACECRLKIPSLSNLRALELGRLLKLNPVMACCGCCLICLLASRDTVAPSVLA